MTPNPRGQAVNLTIVAAVGLRPPLNSFVRFRMRRALVLFSVLIVALPPEAAFAQTSKPVLITIKSDGTCRAIRLTVPCREVGAKLREAGVASDTRIRFTGDPGVSFDVVKSSMDSVAQAGFWNTMIGFITTPGP